MAAASPPAVRTGYIGRDRVPEAPRSGAPARRRPESSQPGDPLPIPTHLPTPSSDWAWFLDVDGTLLEIAATPTGVRAPADLVAILARLDRAHGGAVALVSGRALGDLDRIFAPLHPPAAGLHGLERRAASGELFRHAGETDLGPTRAALEEFASTRPGVIVEDKGVTLAVHYRQAPGQAEAAGRLVHGLADRLGPEYHVQRGKMVLEIKPRSSQKGDAVREFMAEPPFAGRLPVFVGDDITDEDAFSVVNAMGGHSVRVGEDEPTAAAWRLESVGALRGWLRAAAGNGGSAE